MVNETIAASLETQNPETNPLLEGGFAPLPGHPRPLTDESGAPLLPRVVKGLAEGIALPTEFGASRERSKLDAGDTYPAVDPMRLADYEALGRKLQAQVVGEWLGHALARVRDAVVDVFTQPSPATVAGAHPRSVLDAGAAYPAVDPERLAQYQSRGRRLQGQATADLLQAGLVAASAWLARALEPAPAGTASERLRDGVRKGALDVPPTYEERIALYYGRGL